MWKDLLRLFSAFMDLLRNSQLMNAGRAQQQVAQTKENEHEIQVATEARAAVQRADDDVRSVSELPDDGFRRD